MAEIIKLTQPEKFATPAAPKSYSVAVTQYPDNLVFTVDGVRVNPDSLRKIADELEKIVQIIRTDVVVGAI